MKEQAGARVAREYDAARRRWPVVRRVWVALSGGADSSALALLAAQRGTVAGAELGLVHVNHGLHGDAPDWAEHCQRLAGRLGVPIEVVEVRVDPAGPGGLEASARRARRRVYERLLEGGGILCTAHHLQDQAETVLLRLLRGTGVEGLGAIQPLVPLGGGHIARPLLNLAPADLHGLLREAGIGWVEDPANRDEALDRVFLRHRVMPVLRERWPAADGTLSRAAALAREAAAALADTLPRVSRDALDCATVRAADDGRRPLLVRAWLTRNGAGVPSRARMDELLRQVLGAGEDRAPVVEIGHHAVRRYRDRLFLTPAALPAPPTSALPFDGRPTQPLALGDLVTRRQQGAGVAAKWLDHGECEVRYRRGGEVVSLTTDGRRARLKALLQGFGVPPWLRPLLPLVYVDGVLAAVPGHLTLEPFRAAPDEPGLMLYWSADARSDDP